MLSAGGIKVLSAGGDKVSSAEGDKVLSAEGDKVVMIAGQPFTTSKDFISRLFAAITGKGASIENLKKAISECLSKDTPISYVAQSLSITDVRAKILIPIFKMTKIFDDDPSRPQNVLILEEMMKDILHALFSRYSPVDSRSENKMKIDDMTMKQQEKLVDLLGELVKDDQDDYVCHPRVLFGSTRSFVTAVFDDAMLDEPLIEDSGGEILVVVGNNGEPVGFLSAGKDATCTWIVDAAPALGYQSTHTVEVDFAASKSVEFDVNTLDILGAAELLGDITASLSQRNDVSHVVVSSSVSEHTEHVPFHRIHLGLLLQNEKLTFEAKHVHLSMQDEKIFALSCSRLVFEDCAFLSDGNALLGYMFDKTRVKQTRKMRVSFIKCTPSLEILSKACTDGWIESLELDKLNFGTGGVAFFQELYQAKAEHKIATITLGDELKLSLGSGHRLSGGKTIRNKFEAVSSLPCILHVLLYSNSAA